MSRPYNNTNRYNQPPNRAENGAEFWNFLGRAAVVAVLAAAADIVAPGVRTAVGIVANTIIAVDAFTSTEGRAGWGPVGTRLLGTYAAVEAATWAIPIAGPLLAWGALAVGGCLTLQTVEKG